MLNYKDRTILNVIKQLEGMNKIEAYDILGQIEELLLLHKSPICYDAIRSYQHKEAAKNNIHSMSNDSYCFLVDSCQYIKIYAYKSWLPKYLGGHSLYFTLTHDHNIIPFDNYHIKQAFENSSLKNVVNQFLQKNNAKKKNTKTKRLLLLEFLDNLSNDGYQINQ